MTWELWNYRADRVLRFRSFGYKLHRLLMNISTFTSSQRFTLKNWTLVILMLLDRVPSTVQSSASWVMRGGHRSSQVPSCSLGHSCGTVFLKSLWWSTFLMVAEETAPLAGQFGSVFQKPVLQPGACFSSLSLIFMFLIHASNSFSASNTQSGSCVLTSVPPETHALIYAMRTTTLWEKYYYPLSQSEETEAWG